ncbi:MAG: integrin alpha, partial [Planctomycetota bacterium]
MDSPTTRPERRKPAELRVGSAPTPPPGFTASSISELIRRPVYADARAGIGSVVVARDGERTTLRSGLAGDLFGHAAAIIPDVNGDGVEDVAVGAPLSDIGATDTGAAYVLDGATGRPLARMRGGRGSLLGRSIAPAGDFDGDGRQDLAIGAVSFTDGMIDAGSAGLAQGELWIYSTDGRPLARFRSRYLMDAFGRDVVSIGDHNQDGFDDLAVLADAAIDRTEDAAGDRIYIIPGGPARKNVQDADEAASTLLDPRTLIGTAIASDEV